jgi:hypothetical protein
MRTLTVILLAFLLSIAPMLAVGSQTRPAAEDCPLTEGAVAADARKKPPAAPEDATPMRDTRASGPRARLRWQSLVPGMMK